MERDKIPAERMLGNISLSDLKSISQEDIDWSDTGLSGTHDEIWVCNVWDQDKAWCS